MSNELTDPAPAPTREEELEREIAQMRVNNQVALDAFAAADAEAKQLRQENEQLQSEVTKLRLDTATLTRQRDTFKEGFQKQSRLHEASAARNKILTDRAQGKEPATEPAPAP